MAMRNDGTVILVGEGEIADTPVGLPVELPAGETAAVSARLHVAMADGVSDGRNRAKMEVTVINNRNEPATFEWHQEAAYEGSVVSATKTYETRDGEWVWLLRLKPREHIVLQYVLEEAPY